MEYRDKIEFYHNDKRLSWVWSSMVPLPGSLISILGVTWSVVSVSYSLDYAKDGGQRGMRCNVELAQP